MCVNNLPKVATQLNSGATRDSNRGRRILIPSSLTTRPPSHTTTQPFTYNSAQGCLHVKIKLHQKQDRQALLEA